MFPVSHGQGAGGAGTTYPSSAYFVRHDASARELLFFGDVEPDAVAAEPGNAEVWRAAAPKVPHALGALFIECSWPAGRARDVLYGHLSPEHLADELGALALEVACTRQRQEQKQQQAQKQNGPRKKKRRNTDSLPSVKGALEGLRVYIIHCKDDIEKKFDEPIHKVIADQVRELVDAKELGAEIIAVEQGMHICTSTMPFLSTSG